MKKRLLALALALSCVGLCVPALAADVSKLDAKMAAAYLQVLNAQISKCGINDDEKYSDGLIYADVVDMDANGTPEMILFDAFEGRLTVMIWSIQSGKAAQTCWESSNGYRNRENCLCP